MGEVFGEVELGSAVNKFKVGDRAVVLLRNSLPRTTTSANCYGPAS